MRSLKLMLLALDVALIALFLAGYLARYVHPRMLWWLQLIAIGFPVLVVLVVGVTAWLGVTGPRALFMVHVGLCVLAGLRFAPQGRSMDAVPSDAAVLRVVTANANADYFGREGRHRIEALLREAVPDIVAMQEARLGRGGEEGVAASPLLFPLVVAPEYHAPWPEAPPKSLALPVFTRLPSEDYSLVELGDDEAAAADAGQRGRAVLQWGEHTIAVYNVHLRSFSPLRPWRWGGEERVSPRLWVRTLRAYREDFLARAKEATLLRDALEQEALPFIVCGDLNSTPHQWVYRHVSKGLTDSFAAAGRGVGGTYHERLPLVRIDYIFASPHWSVTSARVISRATSDHRPVRAEMILLQPHAEFASEP